MSVALRLYRFDTLVRTVIVVPCILALRVLHLELCLAKRTRAAKSLAPEPPLLGVKASMVQARAAASVVASCKKQNLARPDAVNEDTSAGAAAAPAAATPRKPPNNMRRSSSMQPPKDYKFSWVARMLRQRDVREAYRHLEYSEGIAVLIMGNFITNLIEKQMDPTGSLYHESWKIVENCWNSIFVVELAWNMWAHWAMTAWRPARHRPAVQDH